MKDHGVSPDAVQRQCSPHLEGALAEAVRMFRAHARDYRNPSNPRGLDKGVRKSLAATYNEWALAIERLVQEMNTHPDAPEPHSQDHTNRGSEE